MAEKNGEKLTPKQKKFCDEWLICGNNTRAYQKVYGVKNSDVAASNANRLLNYEKVKRYISERQEKLAQKYEITQARVLQEEMCLAYVNVAELWGADGWTMKSPKELPEAVQRAIASVRVRGKGDDAEYKYTFWDKGKALERISKHLGLYEQDNRQQNGPVKIVITRSDPDSDE